LLSRFDELWFCGEKTADTAGDSQSCQRKILAIAFERLFRQINIYPSLLLPVNYQQQYPPERPFNAPLHQFSYRLIVDHCGLLLPRLRAEQEKTVQRKRPNWDRRYT